MISRFEAKLDAPGGYFIITEHGLRWEAEDEDAPPHVWGWQTLDLAHAYFTEIIKVIETAQEANR